MKKQKEIVSSSVLKMLPQFSVIHAITDRLNDGEIRSLCGSYRLLSDSIHMKIQMCLRHINI